MKTMPNELPHIPVEYVAGVARTKKTDGQRKPYVDLIKQWAEHESMEEAGLQVVSAITGTQQADPDHMPKELYQTFRKGEKAHQLIQIIRHIDDVIQSRDEMWTWAHVMRVMMDENILMPVTPNRFDTIICSMIPGKGRDTVRKNGDYEIMSNPNRTYRTWTSVSELSPTEASNKEICQQIALCFAPILNRPIRELY